MCDTELSMLIILVKYEAVSKALRLWGKNEIQVW